MRPSFDGRRDGGSRKNKLMLSAVIFLGTVYAVLLRFKPYNERPISVIKHDVFSHSDFERRGLEFEQLKERNLRAKAKYKALQDLLEATVKDQTVIDEVRTFLDGTQGRLKKETEAIVEKGKEEQEIREPDVSAGIKSWTADTRKKYLLLEHKNMKTFVIVGNNAWLSVHGDSLTPLKERGFEVIASERAEDGVLLRSLRNGKLVRLVPPELEPGWVFIADGKHYGLSTSLPAEWKSIGSPNGLIGDSEGDQYVFRLEEDTYVYNKGVQAYMTVVDKKPDSLRGHGNSPRKGLPATRESEAAFIFHWFGEAELRENMKAVEEAEKVERMNEEQLIRKIQELPKSQEKRVISYGLYGSRTKYTNGALRNMDLLDTFFPGWTIRFYVDETVPPSVIKQLNGNGAEIIKVENSHGSIAGMFWRFLVADDPTVDRYIIRDSDSRLNARDRIAVEEWIASNKSFHSVRDHPNHCRPLNGGLWGGTKGAVKDMQGLVRKWSNKDNYGADLTFLNSVLWPMIEKDQISHDAYCCEQYPNSHPFPTKRPDNYQHVGQVFDENDKPRMDDIDRFIKNKDIPDACRKRPTWRYG